MSQEELPSPIEPELTPEEPVEEIPFNPDNEASGDRKIVINGEEKIVHFTNNFWTTFASYTRLVERGKEAQSGIDKAYKEEFDRLNVQEIFEQFGQQYPALYRKMEEINDRWAEIQRQRQVEIRQAKAEYGESSLQHRQAESRLIYEPELMAEKDYYFSMAYDGIVPIAKNINPNFDTGFFIT
jgi:hypothetical protein